MSHDRKFITVISLIVVLFTSLYSLNVHAQQATRSSFDQSRYYQGDSGSLTVTIVNNHSSYQITTKQCYLQFDWQQTQNLVYDSGATPIIASGSSYTFSFSFSIPDSVAIGIHSFKVVWVDNGILLGSVVVATGSINVGDAYEKVFLNLQPTISNNINSASFVSQDAKSILTQAQSAYQQAITLANQGKFQDAITDLNSASDFLSRAQAAENTYQAAYSAYQTLLQSVQTSLAASTTENYRSPDAQSYLSQAQTFITQAIASANSGQFQDATTKLNSVVDLLSKVQTAENTYQAANSAYQSLLQSVQTKLNQATNANYKSPDAQSYLSQAQTYYSQATTSAGSGQLQDATSKLTSASNLLDQATAAEKSYVSNPATLGGNPQLWYFLVIEIVIIIVATLIIMRRGKSSKTEASVKT